MSDKLFRISTPTIKYTIDDEFDMSRVASSRFIICNMGNKNRIVKENPTIEGMAFRTDLTQEETKKLNAGIISAQIHILLNNHKVIWTDIAKTTMNGVLGEDMFDVPDYSADTGEYEIDFHGTVSDYDVPLHGHLDVTLEGSTVIPNPEGEATDDLTKVEIDGEIFLVKDSTIYDWARAEEKPTYTKAEVGLDNVDNTSDLNKPISTATQTALDGKVDKDGNKVLSDNNYSDTDKTKLDGIEAEANKTVVDNSVTSTSTNPVESKAIYNLLNDLLPEATATGNPISITNASGLNAKSLKVELEPIQDLHGYDSPWVEGSGYNKWDEEWESGSISGATGEPTPDDTRIRSKNFIKVSPSTQYYFFDKNSIRWDTFFYDTNKGILSNTGSSTSASFTTPANCEYVKFRMTTTSLSTGDVSINYPSSITTYYPYSNICPISGRTQTTVSVNNEDTTIQFGQTVYGGEVDVTSGVLKITHATVQITNVSLSNGQFYAPFPTDMIKMAGNYTVAEVRSNLLPTVASYGLITNNALGVTGFNDTYGSYPNQNWIYFGNGDPNITTQNQMKTWLNNNPLYVCYKLATPIEVPLTPQIISLLKGNNTLTADGDMELIYSKTPQ